MKILISLEGNAASFADAAQPENRAAFVSSCIDMFVRGRFGPGIKASGIFDGFRHRLGVSKPEDAPNYLALLQEFRKQLNAVHPGLKLTIAAGPSPGMYYSVDFAAVAQVVDLVGLMNYDYVGPWRKETGFHAPLYSEHSGSADRTVRAYEDAGVPADKLLLGVPFYGYSWKAVSAENHGLFQPGEAVHQDRPYRYIQTLIASSTVYRDPAAQAPWLYDGDTFWTYEDAVSARFKSEYAQQRVLGGVDGVGTRRGFKRRTVVESGKRGIARAPTRPKVACQPAALSDSLNVGAAKE